MAQRGKPHRSSDSESDHENSGNPEPYTFGRTSQDNSEPDVPSFLFDFDGQESSPEEINPVLRRGFFTYLSSKVLLAVAAAAIVATLFAWVTSDATRSAVRKAKASIASATSPETASAEQKGTKLSPGAAPSKATASHGATALEPARAPVAVATSTPSREEISDAYRRAAGVAREGAPVAAAPEPSPAPPPSPAAQEPSPAQAVAPPPAAPQAAPAPARQISAQELSVLVGRAKEMLSQGDIASARLLLQRAAEARDADAALMLAQTYDPDVLGTPDVRDITPEPSTARAWYEKAAQLGSAEARRRLAQLPN